MKLLFIVVIGNNYELGLIMMLLIMNNNHESK